MSAATIEAMWDQFVPRMRGERAVNSLGTGVAHPNADYVFREDNIVAELKVLTTDLERTPAGQQGINRLLSSWERRGLIPLLPGGHLKVPSSKIFPKVCQIELADYFGKRLKKDISDANRQIKETKAALNMLDAFGFLILVNDGSYNLAMDGLRWTLSHCLRPRHDKESRPLAVPNKSIDNVVFLTIDMPLSAPGIPEPMQSWVSAFRDSRQIPDVFLSELRVKWMNYMADVTGAPVRTYDTKDHSLLDRMKFTQTGRKPPYWSKGK